MGGGILPVAYHNGKAKFLFSREALHTDDDPGKWSDLVVAKKVERRLIRRLSGRVGKNPLDF